MYAKGVKRSRSAFQWRRHVPPREPGDGSPVKTGVPRQRALGIPRAETRAVIRSGISERGINRGGSGERGKAEAQKQGSPYGQGNKSGARPDSSQIPTGRDNPPGRSSPSSRFPGSSGPGNKLGSPSDDPGDGPSHRRSPPLGSRVRAPSEAGDAWDRSCCRGDTGRGAPRRKGARGTGRPPGQEISPPKRSLPAVGSPMKDAESVPGEA